MGQIAHRKMTSNILSKKLAEACGLVHGERTSSFTDCRIVVATVLAAATAAEHGVHASEKDNKKCRPPGA